MCFYRKRLKRLETKIDELTEIIKTQELVKLREKEKDYANVLDLLSSVNIEVDQKKCKIYENQDTGGLTHYIAYKPISVTLNYDNNGDLINNDKFFYATNYLGISDYESQEYLCNAELKIKNTLTK